MEEILDPEERRYSKNFTIRRARYDKLLVLMKDAGFKVENAEKLSSYIAVYITKKIIITYGRRIDKDRLIKGLGAIEPISQKLEPCEKDNVEVHVRLTESENKYLDDLCTYHYFIDENSKKKLYSRFLSAVIMDKWHKREESIRKANANGKASVESDLDNISLDPDTSNWLGERD